ncbi:hypothetical protein [Pyrobaculum neutrophilum]|uniref:hypothetical protein n=1 Tax=Pyrobaculum neutrophilum TaxID=70771 RepID=UPI0011E52ECE|nr:hypothetical protein [Pyrobaculum neutrophilum]
MEKIVRLLGLEIKELSPCDIYINYFMKYIAELERRISHLREKIDYLERTCSKNVKETNK